MSDNSKTLPRPTPVTVSAGLIVIGSITVVILAFDAIAQLRSIENREAIESALRQQPFKDLNLTVESALAGIRVMSMVAGGSTAAAAILGVYVFQRNRGARVALTILAPVIFVSCLATGGFLGTMITVACLTLWLQPARDWFDGVAQRPKVAAFDDPVTRTPVPSEPVSEFPPGPTTAAPSASQAPPPGTPSALAPPAPPPTHADIWTTRPPSAAPATTRGFRPPSDPRLRPGSVTLACALSWFGSALVLFFTALSVLMIWADPDSLIAELEKQQPEVFAGGVTADLLVRATFVVGCVVIVWCAATLWFATLAFRRVAWARVALVASSACAAVICMMAAVTVPALLLLVAACIATSVLLLRADVRTWYAGT
ncbi:MAG: hypothetical protein ACRCYQ_09105 [Nocardioides sp.]